MVITYLYHLASNIDVYLDVLDIIEEYVKTHPEVTEPGSTVWVQGMGWDQTRWFGWRGGFPTAVRVIPSLTTIISS